MGVKNGRIMEVTKGLVMVVLEREGRR